MIVKKRPGCIGETVLSDILVGLKYIIDERVANIEPTTDVADKLACRKLAARLAYRLFRYFSSQKEEIPKIVIDWKAICTSPSEFAEVRNEWVLQED